VRFRTTAVLSLSLSVFFVLVATSGPSGAATSARAAPSVESTCSPPSAALAAVAHKVASGAVGGSAWSLWAHDGESGATALEDGGILLGGRPYPLCPGFPNPAELEMVDAGPHAVVYGVVGYPGRAAVRLSVGTPGSLTAGTPLPAPAVRVVDGVSFFVGSLPVSACAYHALELDATAGAGAGAALHNVGFGTCVPGALVPITESTGSWTGAGVVPPLGETLPKGVVTDGEPGCSTAQAPQTSLRDVSTSMTSVSGPPFGVLALGDDSFVSLGDSVGVFSDSSFRPTLVRTVALPGQALGEAVTPDGRDLLVAVDSGAAVLSVAALESGAPDPVLGTLAAPDGQGAIEVAVSPDGNFAFVSEEDTADAAVFDLRAAVSSGFRSPGFVGTIPLGLSPVGLAVSGDGRDLYATSEGAATDTDEGTLTIIDLRQAETDPSASVVATVAAGCEPVRVVTSGGGAVVWVTARASDQLVAFSAARLLTDPSRALLAHVRVGEAPVGLVVLGKQNLIVVADSNRFGVSGASASLSVVGIAAALAHRPALLGDVAAGGFPRQFALEPDGTTLLVTNYDSEQLEAVDVGQLPR
jgi:DNA-binding beta-propeller fold protein YncE